MVGRSGQDGHGAVDLFGQHGAHEGVRPGLGPEGQLFAGGGKDACVQPVRPADDEDRLAANNNDLDEGETTDTQDTVDEDVRETNAVNDNLES